MRNEAEIREQIEHDGNRDRSANSKDELLYMEGWLDALEWALDGGEKDGQIPS
jgi:hypothetical protein